MRNPWTILLVDDAPDKIKEELCAVLDTFMPSGYRLWHWNPAKNGGIWLKRLAHYNSLENNDWVKESSCLYKWRGNETEAPPSNIKNTLDQVDFILVDLLYRVKDCDQNIGAELVRGMKRLAIDIHEQPYVPPRFIILSRADDMTKIQRAMRAGASGYVLKNRLLSLPAELARLRFGAGQTRCLPHRNFQALDLLPNETQGLLHEIKIRSIQFAGTKNNEKVEEQGVTYIASDLPKAQRMAVLLRAIPKPDLHLHVGSCMTPEYLVVASLVMLAEKYDSELLKNAILPLFQFWSGKARLSARFGKGGGYIFDLENAHKSFIDPVAKLGSIIREKLKDALNDQAEYKKQMVESVGVSGKTADQEMRSILHSKLGIRDHWSESRACDELDKKDAVTLMLFALSIGRIKMNGDENVPLEGLEKSDILRLFILFMAAQYKGGKILLKNSDGDIDIFRIIKNLIDDTQKKEALDQLKSALEIISKRANELSDKAKKDNYAESDMPLALEVFLTPPNRELLKVCPTFTESPLEFLVATGTRSRTLAEYLAGCEYSGSEHLRRACLMRLYARQTLEYLVRHGVLYAELRAAVSGYASKGHLTYQEACNIFQRSFSEEQKAMMEGYRAAKEEDTHKKGAKAVKEGWLWCSNIISGESMWKNLFSYEANSSVLDRYFPAKVNLIFTGKRHKTTREMVMEAAAGVMLSSEPGDKAITANDFTRKNMESCRFVGFDLAGPEEAFPPEMFRNQFDQLSHMHIPITAHAGENASAQFVESAVLDLRARRLGHGLALADDEKLMTRVREERICIELCPVSNYQTNEFVENKPGANNPGRKYPLKKFLDYGNIICLNTDNPIVSYTNIVKEFFQASYAHGEPGLSLWDALRMIRMGFVHSFKGLMERRALLELVEQMIFDLLIDPEVEKLLRDQAATPIE